MFCNKKNRERHTKKFMICWVLLQYRGECGLRIDVCKGSCDEPLQKQNQVFTPRLLLLEKARIRELFQLSPAVEGLG